MFEPKAGSINIKGNRNKKIKEVPDIPEVGHVGHKGENMSKHDLHIVKPGGKG